MEFVLVSGHKLLYYDTGNITLSDLVSTLSTLFLKKKTFILFFVVLKKGESLRFLYKFKDRPERNKWSDATSRCNDVHYMSIGITYYKVFLHNVLVERR